MLCNHCGQENPNKSVFCSNCGHHLSQAQSKTPPPLTPINISKNAQISNKQHSMVATTNHADTLLAAFVGDKYDQFYRDKWFKDSTPTLENNKKINDIHSFNIAGLFLGLIWLCYRKMYLLAFLILLGITVVDLVLMHLLGMKLYNMLGQSAFMLVWIMLTGVLGNYFYWKHSVKQVEKMTGTTADLTIIQQQLAKKGGTSWVGAIGVSLLILIVSGFITYLLAPNWYWL